MTIIITSWIYNAHFNLQAVTNNVTCYFLSHWLVPMEAHLKLTHVKFLQSAKQQHVTNFTTMCLLITCEFEFLLISLGASTVKWTTLALGTSLTRSDSKLYYDFEFCEKIVNILKTYWSTKPSNLCWPKNPQKKSTLFWRWCKWCASGDDEQVIVKFCSKQHK